MQRREQKSAGRSPARGTGYPPNPDRPDPEPAFPRARDGLDSRRWLEPLRAGDPQFGGGLPSSALRWTRRCSARFSAPRTAWLSVISPHASYRRARTAVRRLGPCVRRCRSRALCRVRSRPASCRRAGAGRDGVTVDGAVVGGRRFRGESTEFTSGRHIRRRASRESR